MEKMHVKQAIICKQGSDSENYHKFLKLSQKRKTKIKYAKMGDKINIDNELYLDILWPNEHKMISQNNLNNNSIVCKLNYKKTKILFTGDIEEIAEKEILKQYSHNSIALQANILKIAHHCSKTSNTEQFLNTVMPRIALIGVGRDNKFGHPSDGVIDRLKSLKTKIYRTDRMGEIFITINGNGEIEKIKTMLNNDDKY